MSRGRMCVPLLTLIAACNSHEVTGIASTPMTVTCEPADLTRTGTRLTSGTLRCDADMTILAHGKSDHHVVLQSISTTFYDSTGAQLNTIASSPVDWFGVGTLKRDEQAVAHRQPTGSGPFKLVSTLTYIDQFGTSNGVSFTFRCT